jgi:hypothetical protein
MSGYTTKTSEAELAFGDGVSGPVVKRAQEWLCLQGKGLVIDGSFGPATDRRLSEFAQARQLPYSGTLTSELWNSLTSPMQIALLPPAPFPSSQFSKAVLQCAKGFWGTAVREVGGQNRGPWVRLFMGGLEGQNQPWCAGFVSFVLQMAASFLHAEPPIDSSTSSSHLARQAKALGRLVAADEYTGTAPVIFLVRGGKTGFKHTGFAYDFDGTTFQTVEGNTNESGSSEGNAVCSKVRTRSGKDVIILD